MILTVLEGDEKLKKISLELIGCALDLGGPVTALAIGKNAKTLAGEAATLGVQKALYVEQDEVSSYATRAYARAVHEAAKATGATLILLGATSLGKDLGPRLSGRLASGLSSDVTGARQDGSTYIFRRPVFAGKAFVEEKPEGHTVLATLRPNAFRRAAAQGGSAPVEALPVSFEPKDLDGRVSSVEMGGQGKVELTEADIVVSGGRGLKGPENFHLVEELAQALGAAVGASRAVVDAGWRPHPEQVGQTGKTVSPSLYFALGISGAVQHLAGMSSSKLIVAVNKDAEAPIFQIADYGVVGDALEVLPHLIQEVKELKG